MDVQLIQPNHVEPGIRKYKGIRISEYEELLEKSKHPSEVYRFHDNRILVVPSKGSYGFLYKDLETFLAKIVLD